MSQEQYIDENGDHDPKIYVVLGMHRSGTTALARILEEAGVAMHGDPRWHHEDLEFVYLNQAIIQDAGGIWREPPGSIALLKAGSLRGKEIEDLLARRRASSEKFWGWKDPRQVLTARSYVPFFRPDEDVYLLCLVRKPARVVQSLVRLGQATEQQAWRMVRRYTYELIETIRDFVGVGGEP